MCEKSCTPSPMSPMPIYPCVWLDGTGDFGSLTAFTSRHASLPRLVVPFLMGHSISGGSRRLWKCCQPGPLHAKKHDAGAGELSCLLSSNLQSMYFVLCQGGKLPLSAAEEQRLC